MKAYIDKRNHERWFVADLPGHIGTLPAITESGKRADWGFTTRPENAIDLTPYWQRRFLKYARETQFNERGSGLIE